MTPTTTDAAASVALHWNRSRTSANWWTCKPVIRELNRRICGKTSPDPNFGLINRALAMRGDERLELGVSVGCGTGLKEMALVKAGLVDRMRGYDVAASRIAQARARAQADGLADRMEFVLGDAFLEERGPPADLIYWDNSLHHMFDVKAALEWSFARLRSGGMFVMNDYVGPSRFALSEEDLHFVNRVREPLPDRLFDRGESPRLPKRLKLPWLQSLIVNDPSEMVDCGGTLDIVESLFPDAEIIRTGGLTYFVAMNGLYAHLRAEEQDDGALLHQLMLLDEMYTRLRPQSTLYAVVIARKP